MLDLSQVISDIHAMGQEAHRRSERVSEQMAVALAQASLDGDAWVAAQTKITGPVHKAPWQAAVCGPESPGTCYPLPYVTPDVYTAIATDGSQIPLDRHAIAPCYLLNVGEIVLHYGTGERPRISSQATLHYTDADIYPPNDSGEQTPLSEKIIANRRFLAESRALAALIEENKARHAVALVDDPLIVWTPPGEPDSEQKRIINEFCLMLDAGCEARTPVAGYVSRPGGRDVVGALRLTLCDDDCRHGALDKCSALSRLTDAQLFSQILAELGSRSIVFGSSAANLKHYPEQHKVHFFYLNAGSEIARIEIPEWVASQPDLLDRAHVLCYDQARKGQGYPISLSEAHERAVVRGPEREAFFQLVQQVYVRENIPVLHTRKAMAKRTRII